MLPKPDQKEKINHPSEGGLFVDIFPVSDLEHEDDEFIILLAIYHSIITYSQSVGIIFVSLELLRIESSFFIGESFYLIEDLHHILIRNHLYIFRDRASIGDFILWRHLWFRESFS